MKRAHRTAHRLIWLVLIPAILAISVLALGQLRTTPLEVNPERLAPVTLDGESR